jgi:hypothetical protein
MRARLALATMCLAGTALGAAPPATSSPAPAARDAVVDEVALASWTFPTGDPGRARWFFAAAFRDTVAGGRTRTIAFVVKGICRDVRGGRVTSCRGRGAGGEIPAHRFEADPALRSARLRVAGAEVRWAASERTLPYGYLAGEGCQAGSGEGAGMQQVALAGGRLFGRKVSADAVEHAMMSRGAMFTECTRSLLHRVMTGGVVRLSFR